MKFNRTKTLAWQPAFFPNDRTFTSIAVACLNVATPVGSFEQQYVITPNPHTGWRPASLRDSLVEEYENNPNVHVVTNPQIYQTMRGEPNSHSEDVVYAYVRGLGLAGFQVLGVTIGLTRGTNSDVYGFCPEYCEGIYGEDGMGWVVDYPDD